MISPQILQRYPFLAGAGEEGLGILAMASERLVFVDGAQIFEEGAEAVSLYVISKGTVDLLTEVGSGDKVVVDTLVAGELLGLSAILRRQTWNFTAVATGKAELIAIDGARLMGACDEDPRLGYNLLRGVVEALNQRLGSARHQLAACD